MRKLYLTLLLCLAFVACYASLSICYRLDDIWMRVNDKNDSIINLFAKYEIPLTVGIIPFDSCGDVIIRNDERLEKLKTLQSKGLLEVALHGYAHYLTGINGELDGLDYQTQLCWLSKGKYVLDSIFQTNVSSFIPPYNWYDENTIEVLEKIGIKIISADPGEEFPLIPSPIHYIPYSVGELRKMSQEIRYSYRGGVVLMFHPQEITEQFTLDMLEADLKYIHTNKMNAITLSEMDKLDNFDIKRIRWNKRHNLLTNFFPSLKWWSRTFSVSYVLLLECLNFVLYLLPNFLLLLFGLKKLKVKKSYVFIFVGILVVLLGVICGFMIHPLRSFVLILMMTSFVALIGCIASKCKNKLV